MKRCFPGSAITRNDVAAFEAVIQCIGVTLLLQIRAVFISQPCERCDFTSFGNMGGKSWFMSHMCTVELLRIGMK